jgi:hypothetical protein
MERNEMMKIVMARAVNNVIEIATTSLTFLLVKKCTIGLNTMAIIVE